MDGLHEELKRIADVQAVLSRSASEGLRPAPDVVQANYSRGLLQHGLNLQAHEVTQQFDFNCRGYLLMHWVWLYCTL
jgi:hypothetical protein